MASWLFLLAHHVGLRKLLHRKCGGNSRSILYGARLRLAAFAAVEENLDGPEDCGLVWP